MITGFEEYTEELNDYERDVLLPLIVPVWKNRRGRDRSITNKTFIKRLRNEGHRIDGPRFRKIMHVIRVSGMVPGILATSDGYYVAQTEEEWEDYIRSINERLHHITALRNAIEKQYDNWRKKN